MLPDSLKNYILWHIYLYAAYSPATQQRSLPKGIVTMENVKRFFSSEDKFARHCGIELLDGGPGWAKTRMKIEPYHLNGAGTVHGGAIFTLADFAFAFASNSHGTLAMGINATISFVKAATKGTLYAEAKEQSLNPKLASYSVHISDDDNATVAIFQGMVYRKNVPLILKSAFATNLHE
jgi:acyl-CoA thioesterase